MISCYVDYENVTNKGLKGIEMLRKRDTVYIVYSQNACGKHTFQELQDLLNQKCRIRFIEARVGGKNALDFQLIALMFSNMRQSRHHVVISSDRGYDAVEQMITEKRRKYYRYDSIESALQNNSKTLFGCTSSIRIPGYSLLILNDLRKKARNVLSSQLGEQLSDDEFDMLLFALKASSDRQKLFLHCTHYFGQKRGLEMYTKLKMNFQTNQKMALEIKEREEGLF